MDQGQCKQCSNRCEHCGENNECYRCKYEYRLMTGRCYTCSNNCDTCIGDNICSSCSNPGYYVHNHACVKCPEKCVSCTSNTECTFCTNGFYGKNKCLQECSATCKERECALNGRCKSCVDGMYGDNCNIECGHNCTSCHRSTGGCLSCESGTYPYKNQCKRCPTSCTQCASSSCTDCVVGHRGGHCKNECTKCKPGTSCRKRDGYCQQSCVDGMSDSSCNKPCRPQCLSCQRFSSYKCTACVANKYGYYSSSLYYHCNTDCPHNCQNSTCDDNTGVCTFGCIEGYHGEGCKCPQHCNCDNSNNCISCKEGFGNVNQNCACTNENCLDKDCSACTSLNYFVHDKTCCSCRVQDPTCEECTTRDNGGFNRCTKCKTGYHTSTNYCDACSARCIDKICNPVTGACILGCYGTSWGAHCNKTCGSRCRQCDQQNGACKMCQQGKYSPDCSELCSHSCKTIGYIPRCAIVDGACIDGCQSTKVHGSHCQQSCSINCTDELCDWQTAHCVHGCTDNHYGNLCNNTCSQTCSTPKTGSRCYDINGMCVDGCEAGYYGEMCENQCSPNCVNTTCLQFTGSCMHGCRGRNEGNDCMMEMSNIKTIDFGVTTMKIGIGIGLIIAIIIAVCVIVHKAVRKRRIHEHNETGETVRRHVHRGENISLSNIPNQTETIEQRSDDSEGVEYEQIATGQGSGYEQLKPRNAGETDYCGLDVQGEDNVTDNNYENMKKK